MRTSDEFTSIVHFCLHLLLSSRKLFFNKANVELLLPSTNKFHVRYQRVLRTFEYSIDLFQSFAFRLYPIVGLQCVRSNSLRRCGWQTYDQYHNNNVPGRIDHVRLPADVGDGDGHDENKNDPVMVISIVLVAKRAPAIYLREGIEHELRESNSIGSDRIVHDLRRVQVKKWSPRDGIEALEQEHDGDVTVDEAGART